MTFDPTSAGRRYIPSRARRWIDAALRGGATPPTPPDPRRPFWRPASDPDVAPWTHMGWLWVL